MHSMQLPQYIIEQTHMIIGNCAHTEFSSCSRVASGNDAPLLVSQASAAQNSPQM